MIGKLVTYNGMTGKVIDMWFDGYADRCLCHFMGYAYSWSVPKKELRRFNG